MVRPRARGCGLGHQPSLAGIVDQVVDPLLGQEGEIIGPGGGVGVREHAHGRTIDDELGGRGKVGQFGLGMGGDETCFGQMGR